MFSILSKTLIAAQTRREDGQAMVEYGLILALISVVAIVALALIGTEINKVFEKVGEELTGAL